MISVRNAGGAREHVAPYDDDVAITNRVISSMRSSTLAAVTASDRWRSFSLRTNSTGRGSQQRHPLERHACSVHIAGRSPPLVHALPSGRTIFPNSCIGGENDFQKGNRINRAPESIPTPSPQERFAVRQALRCRFVRLQSGDCSSK